MSKHNTEKTPQGADKVSRYGWAQLDEPGTFELIDKHDLKIPEDSYQRESTSESKVLKIASEFSWIAFGALIVVLRDGQYWVVEGGHRHRASMRRSDITKLPCMVFMSEDEREEAKNYRVINTNRKAMDGVDRHKAYLVEEDRVALMIENMARDADRSVTRTAGPHSIRCVNDLRKCIEDDEDAILRIWPLITELCRGEALHQKILRGLFYIEKHSEESLSRTKWEKRLTSVGYEELMKSISRATAFYSKGGPNIWASGIVQAMNKGLRNRFEFNGAA